MQPGNVGPPIIARATPKLQSVSRSKFWPALFFNFGPYLCFLFNLKTCTMQSEILEHLGGLIGASAEGRLVTMATGNGSIIHYEMTSQKKAAEFVESFERKREKELKEQSEALRKAEEEAAAKAAQDNLTETQALSLQLTQLQKDYAAALAELVQVKMIAESKTDDRLAEALKKLDEAEAKLIELQNSSNSAK